MFWLGTGLLCIGKIPLFPSLAVIASLSTKYWRLLSGNSTSLHHEALLLHP